MKRYFRLSLKRYFRLTAAVQKMTSVKSKGLNCVQFFVRYRNWGRLVQWLVSLRQSVVPVRLVRDEGQIAPVPRKFFFSLFFSEATDPNSGGPGVPSGIRSIYLANYLELPRSHAVLEDLPNAILVMRFGAGNAAWQAWLGEVCKCHCMLTHLAVHLPTVGFAYSA